MSGFSLTRTNKLRADVKKELSYRLAQASTDTPKQHQKYETKPAMKADARSQTFTTEYSYLLTVIDVFSKYAWVFPLHTQSGVETAILLHELFTQP